MELDIASYEAYSDEKLANRSYTDIIGHSVIGVASLTELYDKNHWHRDRINVGYQNRSSKDFGCMKVRIRHSKQRIM